MFVDFDKVFNNNTQSQIQIPGAMLSYLNKQLPEGVKYIIDADGNCVVEGDDQEITLGGFFFKLTEKQKKILGKDYTKEDVLRYSYNAQKPIPLQLYKDGFITLNGKEFPIEKLKYKPLNPIKYVSGSICMIPEPFPKSFVLKLGGQGCEREVVISRIPNDSLDVVAFESDKRDVLFIKYLVNEKLHTLTMNVSFNLIYAKTIRDIVEAMKIYNAYLDGKGYLGGYKVTEKLSGDNIKRFEDASLQFWEKVLKIEECLDVNFLPPQEEVGYDTICLVEQLFQNLINHIPIREKNTIESLDGKWDITSEGGIKESVGKSIYFQFEATMTMNLFGVKKTIPSLVGIFNAVLKEYSKTGKKQRIILEDESSEKRRYTSLLCFSKESDLKEYSKKNHKELVAVLKEAKAVTEYLI